MKTINLCEYCGKGKDFFDTVIPWKFKNHTCRNKTEVFCKECEKCFGSNLILRRHQESVHKSVMYKCLICKKIFKSLPAMSRHKRDNSMNKNHLCELCNKKFSRKELLDKHIPNKVHLIMDHFSDYFEDPLTGGEGFGWTSDQIIEHMHSYIDRIFRKSR